MFDLSVFSNLFAEQCFGFLQLFHQPAGVFQLMSVDDGVECGENPCPEPVGVAAQPLDVLYGISGRLPGPEFGPGDIHGIGTAVYCRDADVSCPGGSQEFKISHQLHLRAVICCLAVAPYFGSEEIF